MAAAEPGEPPAARARAHEVGDSRDMEGSSLKLITMNQNSYLTNHLSPASQAQLDFTAVTPGSAAAIAWGYHSVRQLRRLVECFLSTYLQQHTAKTLSEKQELTNLLHREHKGRTETFLVNVETQFGPIDAKVHFALFSVRR